MKIVTTIIKVLSVIGGLTAYNEMIPPKLAPVAVLVFALASVLKDAVQVVGDWLDNKQIDGSFKP